MRIFGHDIGRRTVALAATGTLVLVVLAATPQLLGTRVSEAFAAFGRANPGWLWLAALGFALSVAAAAGSWWTAIGLCGGRLTLGEACVRFGAGSLVNTFVPARAGDALRIALFSRALPNRGRLWTTGGAFAALGAARATVLAGLVVAGALAGALPLWPVLVLLAGAAAAVAVCVAVRRRPAHGRVAHFLDAFRELGRHPSVGAKLVGWLALGTLGRLAAAAAAGAALGIHHPLLCALIIVPALDLAGLFPVTPGNVGVTSAAVAAAMQAHGVSFTHGLAAGIAFHAVETAVGIAVGLTSVLLLAPFPSRGTRRVVLVAVGASAALAVAGVFSATVLVPVL